jgi:tetratricopeptide (TPR) repeat protein
MSDRGGIALRFLAMAIFALIMLVAATSSFTFFERSRSVKGEERALALKLCDERKELEALPLLEKLAVANPKDRVVCEGLARALVSRSNVLAKESDSRNSLLRARALLTRFKRDGSLSQSGKVLLAMIPPDGRRVKAPAGDDIASVMRRGENAFGRKDFETSFAAYQQAYSLDAKNYAAALYAGDSLFSLGRLTEACEWFERAVEIEPNRATAHRYWGDALEKLNRPAEARERFLDAIIAEPYERTSWLSLNQWTNHNHAALLHPRVIPLASEKGAPLVPHTADGTIHVIRYSETRLEWEKEKFRQEFPGQDHRHSLREEVDALTRVARAVSADLRSGVITRLDPSLALLLKLEDQRLLEPFVLISSADAGIAQDYDAYRKEHRDRLMRYLSEYVAPMPAQPNRAPSDR